MFMADPTQPRERGTGAQVCGAGTQAAALAAYERIAWAGDRLGPQVAFADAADVRTVVRFARDRAISPFWVEILADESEPAVVRQRALARVALEVGRIPA